MIRKVFVGLLICISLFTSADHLLAAESGATATFSQKTALGVNPAIVETVLDAKTPTKRTIILYNLTNVPVPIKTLRESFSPNEKLEIPKDQLARFDAASWIRLASKDTDFILQPKETRKIDVTIIQNPKAPPGGHYASLIFQPLIPQQAISNDSLFIFARVAVLFFMQVRGEVTENISIQSFDVQSTYRTSPISIGITLRNDGNTHVRPAGKVSIFQGDVATAHVNFIPSLILPHTSKTFTVEWSPRNKWQSYEAQATLTYGATNKLLTSSKKPFTIFAYSHIVGITILSLGIALLLTRFQKRIIKAIQIILNGD